MQYVAGYVRLGYPIQIDDTVRTLLLLFFTVLLVYRISVVRVGTRTSAAKERERIIHKFVKPLPHAGWSRVLVDGGCRLGWTWWF